MVVVVVSPFEVGGWIGVEVCNVSTVWSVFGMAMSGVFVRFSFSWFAVVMAMVVIMVVVVVVIMASSRLVF
jgi:hypothetical protein